MIKESLGAEAPGDEEWLECECGHTRELTLEEIEHDLNMRFGS